MPEQLGGCLMANHNQQGPARIRRHQRQQRPNRLHTGQSNRVVVRQLARSHPQRRIIDRFDPQTRKQQRLPTEAANPLCGVIGLLARPGQQDTQRPRRLPCM